MVVYEIQASFEVLANLSSADAVQPVITHHLPRLVNAGVHTAPTGVIQDPAGVAIGSGRAPHRSGAGGASQAIYAAFPDLEPIPNIPIGDSVLNRAEGVGAHVLHTHAPVLSGDPNSRDDVERVLRQLTDVYERAIEVGLTANPNASAANLTINLVPVSGRIFAGPFRDPALDHLHPSYTIAAVLAALCRRSGNGSSPAETVIWVFDARVFRAAERSMESWRVVRGTHPGE